MMASKRSVAFAGVAEGDVGVSSPQPAQNDTTTARNTARRMISRYYLTLVGRVGLVGRWGGRVVNKYGHGRAGWYGVAALPASPAPSTLLAYFKCLLTSFVISNMLTDDLPPNTAFSEPSALIIRLFFLSCRPCFLM